MAAKHKKGAKSESSNAEDRPARMFPMPKRIIIAAVTVVVVGVLVYVLSQPRKGSVEYHLRKR